MGDKNLFLMARSRSELAAALGIKLSSLTYFLFATRNDDSKYQKYTIPKKHGGVREVCAPCPGLKKIQRQISNLLLDLYPDNVSAHGYIKGRSIKTNAIRHLNKRWVVNLDLKDFFPSINFGRVKGIFKASPFSFPDSLARDIANLCCYEGVLPQGAPSSPILSNYVCWKLDNQLRKLANENKCLYTRYADDITFSTNLKFLPDAIGMVQDNKIFLSENLVDIIEKNGFSINIDKTRYSTFNNRQEVTGLVVNSNKVNVRRSYVMQVRAMIHAWEKYGIKKAAKEHWQKYNHRPFIPTDEESSFVNELCGKLNYIRYIKRHYVSDGVQKDSLVYLRLAGRLKALKPELTINANTEAVIASDMPILICEGKTDWKLIKKALEIFKSKGEFIDLNIGFREYNENEIAGTPTLKLLCKARTALPYFMHRCILLCDRDERDTNRFMSEPGKNYKFWGNNIFSMILPVPEHRNFDEICIEMLFSDAEIKTVDRNGRRLYLSAEFSKDTGEILDGSGLIYNGKLECLKHGYLKIIDDRVINSDGKNVALPKRDFANNFFYGVPPFNNFSVEGFRPLFEEILKVLAL